MCALLPLAGPADLFLPSAQDASRWSSFGSHFGATEYKLAQTPLTNGVSSRLSQARGAHTCRWPIMMRAQFSWEQVHQLWSKPFPAMLRLQSGAIRVSARSQSPMPGVGILRSTKACQSGPSMLTAIPPRRGRHAVGRRFGFPGRMPRVGEGARAFTAEGLGSPAAVSWAAGPWGCHADSTGVVPLFFLRRRDRTRIRFLRSISPTKERSQRQTSKHFTLSPKMAARKKGFSSVARISVWRQHSPSL